jgi:transposase-like protein
MPRCPFSSCQSVSSDPVTSPITRKGFYFRSSDSKTIFRYFCKSCKRTFSSATFSKCFMQKKRRVNFQLYQLLVSGVSQRRSALLLSIHKTTVARKFQFLAIQARLRQEKFLKTFYENKKVTFAHFDEMETHELTKCKPLSIPLTVDAHSRKLLAFEVCSMPAKGHLAKTARKKYGFRRDDRNLGLASMMETLKPLISEDAQFLSDLKPSYPFFVKRHFPRSNHDCVKGRRACIVGQGELKRGGYDPLFPLNHTCAMIRANINRLFRRTWCTTKKASALRDHLSLYMDFHNRVLTA